MCTYYLLVSRVVDVFEYLLSVLTTWKLMMEVSSLVFDFCVCNVSRAKVVVNR